MVSVAFIFSTSGCSLSNTSRGLQDNVPLPYNSYSVLLSKYLFRENYFLFIFFLKLCIAFRCCLRSGSSFRPPLTLTDWVVKDLQHLGQKLNFRHVCARSVTGKA